MEDYILREIDRIGEMLMKLARKMGLFLDEVPDYSITDVQKELDRADGSLNVEDVLRQAHPVLYLVEEKGLSDQALELFVEILFRSNLEEDKKEAVLKDALVYLDGKGYYSFKLHAL
jgi:hypothetical protein